MSVPMGDGLLKAAFRLRHYQGAATLAVLIAGLLSAPALFGRFPTAVNAQGSASSTGSIAGSVTADRGDVVALRVKAKDTTRRIAYTVFTSKGRYQINNLPAGTYEVRVLEDTFESPSQTVQVKEGQSATANLTLKFKAPGAVQGAGAATAAAAASYGAAPMANGVAAELVDFDTIYPPAPARDILLKHCFGCHGANGWHRRGRKTEAAWRTAVELMFRPDHRIADLQPGVPLVTYDRVSKEQKEMIVKYLAEHFGPTYTKPKDLKLDTLVRDEAALTKVMYVQYDVQPPTPGTPFPNTRKAATGGLHDVSTSPSMPGVLWLSGNQSDSIVKIDTRSPDYTGRTTRFTVPHPQNWNVVPHGLFEKNGKVYWAELAGDRIGELDPKTSAFRSYPLPTAGGGAHSLRPDSKGNIWYSNYAASGKVGRLNTATGEVKEYEVSKGFSGYGLEVDKQDRVWAVGLNTAAVFGYDPKTDKWTTYPLSNPARRPNFDHKGNIWAAEFFGNKIAMIEPASGKVTEYDLPLKWGNPYEVVADDDDNIWIENTAYGSLVKFEPGTKKFTYVPYPEIKGTTVKFDRDREGTIWFIMPYGGGQPAGLTGFKPTGNVPAASATRR